MILNYATGAQNLLENYQKDHYPSRSYAGSYTKESLRAEYYSTESAFPLGQISSYGLSFHMHIYNKFAWNNGTIFVITDSSGEKVFQLICNSSEQLIYQEYFTTTTPTSLTPIFLPEQETYRFDIQANFDAVSGYFRVYQDNTLVYEITGDTTRGGDFSLSGDFSMGGSTNNDAFHWSAIFLTDGEDTRGIEMIQHEIVDRGRFNDMSEHFYNLRSIGLYDDKAMVIKSNAANQTQTVTLEALPTEVDGYEVIAVGIDSRFKASHTSPNNLAFIIDDGTNVVEIQEFIPEGSFKNKKAIQYTAPDGGAWDHSKVNSLHVGLRSK